MTRAFSKVIRTVVGRAGEEGVELTNPLAQRFRVTLNDGPEPNAAQLTVWGLAQETAERTRERDTLLQIYAGYGETEWLLFLGALTRSATVRDGVDVTTELESGKATVGGSAVSQTLAGQQQLADVLEITSRGLNALGIDTSQVSGPINAPRGVSVAGDPATVLNRLTRANRLDWFVENGIVRFVPRGQPVSQVATVLTPDTGLIGSPRSMQLQLGGGASRAGAELKSVLNGELRVRSIVQVEDTREMAGWYMVRRITHEGSLWGTDPMTTTLECTPVEAR